MTRSQLGVVTVGLLAALFVFTLLVPVGAALGIVLFVVVVALVGILFFRFHPAGDLWQVADEVGINPWWAVVLVLIAAAAWLAFRVGLLQLA